MKMENEVVNKANMLTSKFKKQIRKKKFRLIKRKKDLKLLCKHRGVIYINHIPHGFYEEEIFKFFRQFGVVTAVKVPRSNKSGKSKGFAFVEFKDKDVAKVAADAMNNYLMFDCILQTKFLPPEEQKPIAFDRNGKPWINRKPTAAADKRRLKDRLSKNKTITDLKAFAEKARQRLAKLRENIVAKTGIDYQFQIDDDAQLLKMTSIPDDDKPSPPQSRPNETANGLKMKKLRKRAKSKLAKIIVKPNLPQSQLSKTGSDLKVKKLRKRLKRKSSESQVKSNSPQSQHSKIDSDLKVKKLRKRLKRKSAESKVKLNTPQSHPSKTDSDLKVNKLRKRSKRKSVESKVKPNPAQSHDETDNDIKIKKMRKRSKSKLLQSKVNAVLKKGKKKMETAV